MGGVTARSDFVCRVTLCRDWHRAVTFVYPSSLRLQRVQGQRDGSTVSQGNVTRLNTFPQSGSENVAFVRYLEGSEECSTGG